MPARALPYRPHNHAACVHQALADAPDSHSTKAS